MLLDEGWRFFQLSGRYSVDGQSHTNLFRTFTDQVEQIINSRSERYITRLPETTPVPVTAETNE
jgi:hypothetical protein